MSVSCPRAPSGRAAAGAIDHWAASGAPMTRTGRAHRSPAVGAVDDARRWSVPTRGHNGAGVPPRPPPRPLVLVADDDPSIRALVAAVLTDEGFLCHAVENGAQLVRALCVVRPAAVVLDMRMPQLDGFGVLEHLRTDPALGSIPVVAVSAAADTERVLSAGCRWFLPKPFDLDRLVDAVRTAAA
jgi:CheY-like chemotaxis protein